MLRFPSPIGTIRVTADAGSLTGLTIDDAAADGDAIPNDGIALLSMARAQLEAYFAGDRTTFDLPLSRVATVRGAALRTAICSVGCGRTTTYGALAAEAGSSARAVGQACRRNPLPIIVPCHRVLGAGTAEHYSAGRGVETKRWLLAHERRTGWANG